MDFQSKKIKLLICLVAFVISIMVIGRDLNPFSSQIFSGHDETQPARIAEFTLNLKEGNIPPRIAPDFSYGLGYPVFTYYAPFSYWATSLLNLSGFDIPTSLKLSYLAALTIGFIGFLLMARRFFSFYPSLLASIAYITSPHIAVEIFVRSNLAEMWFFALFPLAIALILMNTKKLLPFTVMIVSFLFLSHNILSLISLPIIFLIAFLSRKRKLNLITFFLSLSFSASFYIPLFVELSQVQARAVAEMTDYRDHFLCPSQLWTSLWGFAGSAKGCDMDGMSFMLGKLHILGGVLGIGVFLYDFFIKKSIQKKRTPYILGIFLLTAGSIFLTLQYSSFLWNLVGSTASVIQFPWRLLLFGVFGLSFFIGYITDRIPRINHLIALGGIIVFIIFNGKFFYSQPLSVTTFTGRYLSKEYIKRTVAFRVPEYLPSSADYTYWRSLEGKVSGFNPLVTTQKNQNILALDEKPFSKLFMAKAKNPITLQIHYAPYWIITKNNIPFIPEKFDKLGRPIVRVSSSGFDSIHILYLPTMIERIANLISFITVLGLIVYAVSIFKPTWKGLPITVKKI